MAMQSSRCIPKRYVIVTLCAVAMCVAHAMRVNIAVTVVTILDKAAPAKVGTEEAVKKREYFTDITSFLLLL